MHNITMRKNGVAEMAYVGQKPWHSLGQELERGAPIEKWQVAAGMDWTVQRSKVRYATERGGAGLREWADREVLMRSDTKDPVGLVSDGFKIVQPKAVLEFFRDLTVSAGYEMSTAGTLRGGSRFWGLASLKVEDRIVGNDVVKGNLLLATAVDGSMKTKVANVATRVVCENTLRIALGEHSDGIEVSHRSVFDEKKVKAKLGIAVDSFAKFITEARALAARRVGKAEAELLIGRVVENNDDDEPIDIKTVADKRAFQRIMDLYEYSGPGCNLPGVKGTAWGLLNAVTRYVDHDRSTRGDVASNRLNSAWFGSGNDMKARAYDATLALLK